MENPYLFPLKLFIVFLFVWASSHFLESWHWVLHLFFNLAVTLVIILFFDFIADKRNQRAAGEER